MITERKIDINAIDEASSALLNLVRLMLNLKDIEEISDQEDVFQLLADYAFRIHKDIEAAVGSNDAGGVS